ncbi:peptide-N(4)-(N-acetyl-beta-glucosaminyl)asparagine amidase-like isoform X3 [Camellia sinensis]|uniref:peptide-N(4)-(N-acetyl-beta- glucosaminyl)asparagine amidase-like isoform X3 n=1 Tax=Camellia sinensis TaxID=4442 RepID=UPI0010356CF1|nr:peptide-N(4)-(N-acetyl-beta-glucosaminyl)asparagine amidase-like isoform X3 [Camellia sinensis]
MGNQKQKWTTEEEEALRAGVAKHGTGKWKNILKDPDFALSLSQRSNIDLKDKWRNMGISTAAHSSKEKIRIPRVKAITAGPLTNGQNSASASLIDDDKDGKTAPRWKKNLNYVIAFAKDGVYDVTKRYSRKWHEVLSRRNITTDPILSIILSNIRRECRQSFASQVISALEDQDRNEAEALERELHSKDDASISLPGRQSGDKEWRMSRSEFGSDEICFPSSSCCPARKCIDEHVTKIYNAFCPIISQFVEKSCSKSRAVEVLLFFKQMLINLKNSPFRTRRTSINPVSNGAQHLFLQMLPSFDQLFDALSLNSELDASGRVDIYLAADPVRTSIALPVLFHALDDVIHNVNMCNNFNKNSLSWPLQKLNRIYSGLVLASGEELSFGIALLSTNFRSHLHLTELECQSGKNQMVPEVKVV